MPTAYLKFECEDTLKQFRNKFGNKFFKIVSYVIDPNIESDTFGMENSVVATIESDNILPPLHGHFVTLKLAENKIRLDNSGFIARDFENKPIEGAYLVQIIPFFNRCTDSKYTFKYDFGEFNITRVSPDRAQ